MPTKKPSGSGEDQQKSKIVRKKSAPKIKKEIPADLGGQSDQPIVYNQPKSVADAAPSVDTFSRPLAASSLHKTTMGSFSTAPMMPPAMPKNTDSDILRDIKKRETPGSKDASFLIPEKFGFDLKKNINAPKGRWINVLIYSLSTLIILLTVLLFLLTFYSGKLIKRDNLAVESGDSAQTTGNADQEGVSQDGQISGYQLAIQNLPADLQTQLSSLLKSRNLNVAENFSGATLPAVQKDTLFVKKSDNPENTSLIEKLATYGIKPEMQTKEDLSVDAVLDMVPVLAKADLGGLTATVYNATGQSGLAKKYCAILSGYKASNCQALNATSQQNGTTIEYKNIKALFNLKRTADFSAAKFSQAPNSQIEDVKVTIGK